MDASDRTDTRMIVGWFHDEEDLVYVRARPANKEDELAWDDYEHIGLPRADFPPNLKIGDVLDALDSDLDTYTNIAHATTVKASDESVALADGRRRGAEKQFSQLLDEFDA